MRPSMEATVVFLLVGRQVRQIWTLRLGSQLDHL